MIVSREREIVNFVKTPYYKVIGSFEKNGEKFNAEWKVNENSEYLDSEKLYNDSGFKKEEGAKELIAKLAGKKATVKEIKKSKQKENAPLLFNLAEIQNECTKRFKIKPSETLDIIQELYEKKLVTYPRTDARVLSTAVSKEISKNLNGIKKGFKDEEVQSILDKMINEKYSTKLEKTKYVNDSKITDHYAIIPTGQGFENYDKLPDLQKNIYKLIVKRFLSIFYPAAEFSKVNLKLEVINNDKKEEFNTSGRVCEIQGYLEIWKDKEETKEENNEEQEEVVSNIDILAKLKKNDEINIDNFEVKEGQTNPPSRYNSGNLILAMENAGKLIEDEALREQIKGAGIGTSATRGEIIKKLERIGYIAINSKTQIVTPTKKGEVIYDVVDKSMPDMLNPKLTASWEKGLEMVANKEIQKDIFMEKLEKYIHSKFDRLIRR
jgi:DNA topoisomerase-3